MARRYVLLDACVPAAHFAPKSTQSTTLVSRAQTLLTGGSPDVDVRFLTPNFSIPEVFAVFEKYRWGRTWNKHVKPSNVLTAREFRQAREGFGQAIHDGAEILQVEFDRYHVLWVDLISPINSAYKINRVRGSKANRDRAKNTSPASTYDMLVAAMGIWLAQQHGPTNLTVVTGDERLTNVLERAKSAALSKSIRQHLTETANRLGLACAPSLYPETIDWAHATKAQFRARFPSWNPSW